MPKLRHKRCSQIWLQKKKIGILRNSTRESISRYYDAKPKKNVSKALKLIFGLLRDKDNLAICFMLGAHTNDSLLAFGHVDFCCSFGRLIDQHNTLKKSENKSRKGNNVV